MDWGLKGCAVARFNWLKVDLISKAFSLLSSLKSLLTECLLCGLYAEDELGMLIDGECLLSLSVLLRILWSANCGI